MFSNAGLFRQDNIIPLIIPKLHETDSRNTWLTSKYSIGHALKI